MKGFRHGAAAAALLLVLVGRADALTISDLRGSEIAEPGEHIRITWQTHSAYPITYTNLYWGTAPGVYTHTETPWHTTATGPQSWYESFHAPYQQGKIYYVVHARDSSGAAIDSEMRSCRVATFDPSTAKVITSKPNAAIPDGSSSGITLPVLMPECGKAARVEVRVDIEHPNRGDLTVNAIAPSGKCVRLYVPHCDPVTTNIQGTFGNGLVPADDLAAFKGEEIRGDWKLFVNDIATGNVGTVKEVTFLVEIQAAAGAPALPNIITLPPDELSVTWRSGRKLLRFGTTVSNLGKGPLYFRGEIEPSTGKIRAYQQVPTLVRDSQGKFARFDVLYEKLIGEFIFSSHIGHNHFHFKDWGIYSILDERFRLPAGVVRGDKTTFCITDTTKIDGSLEGSGGGGFGCGQYKQGISVGWADTYGAGLEDQWVDVTGVPDGVYYIVIEATKLPVEGNPDKRDNDAATKIRLQGDTVTVLEKLDGKQFDERRNPWVVLRPWWLDAVSIVPRKPWPPIPPVVVVPRIPPRPIPPPPPPPLLLRKPALKPVLETRTLLGR